LNSTPERCGLAIACYRGCYWSSFSSAGVVGLIDHNGARMVPFVDFRKHLRNEISRYLGGFPKLKYTDLM